MCRYQVNCFGRILTTFANEADAVQVVEFLRSYKLPCLVILQDEAGTPKISASKSLEDLLLLVTDLKKQLSKINKAAAEWKANGPNDC